MDESEKAATAETPPRWWALLREFFADLFDLRFTTFMATRMLPGVYGLGIVLAVLFTAYLVVQRFEDSFRAGMTWLFLCPLVFVGLVTALRITLEFVLAVFRIAWYIEQVASHTETVSHELPRFGFLRTLLFGEKAPAKSRPGAAKGDKQA